MKRGAPARFGDDNVLRGLRAVRTGQVVSLNLPLDDPVVGFGRTPLVRTMRLHNDVRPLGDGRYLVVNDDDITIGLQASSQWDAFAHLGVLVPGSRPVYHDGHGLEETFGTDQAAHLGIQALGPAIIGRGVLLDLVAVAGNDSGFLDGDVRVGRESVAAAIAQQRLKLHPGDSVLLYTGFERRRAALGGAFPTETAGVDGSTLELWKDLDILALCSDNPAVEGTPPDYDIHIGLLRDSGVPLGELWALDELARLCREQKRSDFLLVSVPLNIFGAFGSTANAVAVL